MLPASVRHHAPEPCPASAAAPAALRLSLVIAHLGIGGAQKVLVTLANAWADAGWPVTLIAVGGSGPSYFPLHPAVSRAVARAGGTIG